MKLTNVAGKYKCDCCEESRKATLALRFNESDSVFMCSDCVKDFKKAVMWLFT